MKNKVLKVGIILATVMLISIMLVMQLQILTSFGVDDTKIVIEAELQKYINYNLSDQDNGTLVQYGIKSRVEKGEDKEFSPIKTSETTIQLNKIDGKYPTNVNVIPKCTEVTNGEKTSVKANYQYNENTGEVVIQADNQNEKGEAKFAEEPSENARDEYIVICYYDTYTADNLERELSIKVMAKNTLFEEDMPINGETTLEAKQTENLETLTSVSYQTDDIYNGYIKSNILNGTSYNTPYQEKEQIMISKKEAQEKIELNENNSENIIYKSTKISKDEMQKLLGEEGSIEIVDENGEILATINKDSQFTEEGTITINYEKEIGKIGIRTSEVKSEGILTLENAKEIKSTKLDLNSIETSNELAEHSIDIKDAKIDVSMEISSLNWTNKQQNDMEFNIYMKANSVQNNMLKNPNVRIELPNEVEKVVLGNSCIVYDNGLILEDPYTEVNEKGNIVIVANLIGTQTQYNENNFNLLTNIKIPVTVILRKNIENDKSNINLSYTNQFTLDGSLEVGNVSTEIQMENYNEEIAQINEGIPLKYEEIKPVIEDNQNLKIEVAPVKGNTAISSGDTLYEGEYVKYNIKVTNTSNEEINNLKIVGSIPEGATYGELVADYNTMGGEYKYNFNENLTEKAIQVGTLKAGEEYNTFYEVQINDLKDVDEIQLTTNIVAYIGDTPVASYQLTNTVKQAEAKVFLGAFHDGGDRGDWTYTVKVTSDETKEGILKVFLPKEVNLKFVTKGNDALDTDSIEIIPMENVEISSDNVVTLKVKSNDGIYCFGMQIDRDKLENNPKIELTSVAKYTVENVEYTTNENRIVQGYNDVSIVMTSGNEGEEVQYEDQINYQIVVTKTGKTNIDDVPLSVCLTDFLPEEVNPVSVTYDTWEIDHETGNATKVQCTENIDSILSDEDGNRLANVELYLNIPYQESAVINVNTTAGAVYQKTRIENNATITDTSVVFGEDTTIAVPTKTSNTIVHTILPYDEEEIVDDEEPEEPIEPDVPENPVGPTNPDVPGNQEQPTDPNLPGNTEEPTEPSTYSISGIAWNDENGDGERQVTEPHMSEINVMLLDTEKNTTKADTKTDSNGNYEFADIEKGKYIVVFQYDTDTYKVAEYQKNGVSENLNCDVISKKVTLQNNSLLVGVTDIITLDSDKSNIDIGLIKNKVCDIKLDKYITKVVVNTKNGTKQYAYNNEKLAKAEIRAKEIEGATVIVEYSIILTNVGEVPAIVNKVIDAVPEGFTFSSELNKNWAIQATGKLVNTSTSNQKIQVGESRKLTLILTKSMTANNTGIFKNIAEISEISNSLNIEDSNTSNNSSSADIIISISTGAVTYISIGIIILTLVGIGMFLGIKFKWLKIGGKLAIFVIIFMTVFTSQNMNVQAAYPQYTTFTWKAVWGNNYDVNYYREKGRLGWTSRFYGGPDGHGGWCIDHGAAAGTGNYVFSFVKSEMKTIVKSSEEKDMILSKLNSNFDVNVKEDNGNYILGPFKYSNDCNVKSYTCLLYDNNGQLVTGGITCDKNGEAKALSVSATSSEGRTFYIKISADKCNDGISKVVLKADREKTKITTITRSGYVVYNYAPDYQRVETDRRIPGGTDPFTEKIFENKQIEWIIKKGALTVIKQDLDDENLQLDDIEFMLWLPEVKLWEKEVKNGKVDSGETSITRTELLKAEYKLEKVAKNGKVTLIKTYKVEENGGEVTVKLNKLDDGVYRLSRKKRWYGGNLAAGDDEKYSDAYNPEKSNSIVGNRYKIESGQAKQGVTIDNLPIATYKVVETINNHYGYKVEKVGEIKVKVNGGPNEFKLVNVKQTGNLEIMKIDFDTNKPQEGVGFKIKGSNGQYVQVVNKEGKKRDQLKNKIDGKQVTPAALGKNIVFVDGIENGTEFITDVNGKINIIDILIGKYTIEETSLGGYRGYELSNPTEVKNKAVERQSSIETNKKVITYKDKGAMVTNTDNFTTFTAKNAKQTGNLEIIKIDLDTETPQEGIGFKIKKSDGKYVQVVNSAGEKQDQLKNQINEKIVTPAALGKDIIFVDGIENGTEFITDANGKINIIDILIGDYTIEETSLGNYRGYQLSNPEDVTNKKLERQSSVETSKIVITYEDKGVMTTETDNFTTFTAKNERTTGDLKIIKKDADKDDLKLSGIGFKIKTADGYLQLKNAQGEIQTQITGTYSVEDVDRDVITNAPKETATEFITDANGEIYIANILVGEYTVEETSLGENAKYYDITGDDGQPVHEVVMVKKPTEAEPWTEITLKNKRKYIDLWGYVWINRAPDDKNTPGINDGDNSLYNGTTQDIHDQLFSGIEVRLKDRTTNEIVSTMVTGKVANSVLNVEEGHYYFEKVSIDKLQDYYIEFEYDGLTYESSPARVDRANGSKAIEGENRTAFNNKFSVVEGPQSGETSSIGHTNALTLNYSIKNATGNERAKATLEHDNNFIIQSDTDKVYDGGIDKMQVIGDNGQFYTADYIRKNAVTEVPDINLGLFERSQPDLRIAKDIKNVKLTINHKSHVYNYSQVIRDDGTEDPGNNVGVVFGTKSNPKSYYRAIYEADLNYEDPNDKNNELEAYVTYQIKIYNDSNVIVRVNSIADYADERYHLEKIGTKYNKDTGDIENNVNSTDSGNIGNYHKYVIETNAVVGANENANIYVQFKLNRNDLKGIFGENDSSQKDLENVVEINSYSPLKDGAPYAGIDIDSNPGNCVPLEYNGENEGLALYEDDTDISQPLKLVINGPRKISGTVFIDNADEGKLQELQIREGNGQLDNGEIGVKGVTVTLNEKSGSSKSYTQTTDDNGNFTIEGYIPGDYELTYTWGGQTYTLDGKQKTISVQDYKGTIYDKERYTDNYENGNTKWYKGTDKNNPEIRYTDAVDDWNRRQDIDKEINPFNGKTNSKITINTMDSTTPEMDIGVELDDFNDEQNGVSYANEIDNVDFGIIERAKQEVSMSKRIESIKVTLANGQVLADLTIGEDGTITGERKNVTYERPTGIGPWNTKHGFAKLELDNELLQGTVVEVGYIITATNNSEKDYTNEEYYYYGNGHQDVNKLVEITNLDVIDYLDRDWGYESDKNLDWDIKEKEDLNGRVIPEVLGTENSEEDEQVTKINEKLILEQKLGDINLKPGEKKSVELKVSKLVTTSSEINLDNETEVIEIDKTGGSRPTSIPGNYIPGTGHTEPDDAVAERTIVAPSTGGDQNYIIPILIGTTLLVILGTGVIFIKKKIIKSDD